MIVYRVNEKVEELTCAGDMEVVEAEILLMIGRLYSALMKQDKGCAIRFRGQMTGAIADPESPVWKVDEDIQGIFIVQSKEAAT